MQITKSRNHSITQSVEHRPWPLPEGSWAVAMSWHDLLFAHWPVPVDDLRRAVPPPLQMDTYEGQAWIGVVPFRMTAVRPRWLPSIPWFSAFPELNVRTYVTADGKAGVYFFSLDAGNRVAVKAARAFYRLPYFHARMSVEHTGDVVWYRSRRISGGGSVRAADFSARYRPTGGAFRSNRGSLENWLTERYCLFVVDSQQRIYRGEIHHLPWPLQPAEAQMEVNTMTLACGVSLPDIPPLLHFARHLEVVAWPLRRV